MPLKVSSLEVDGDDILFFSLTARSNFGSFVPTKPSTILSRLGKISHLRCVCAFETYSWFVMKQSIFTFVLKRHLKHKSRNFRCLYQSPLYLSRSQRTTRFSFNKSSPSLKPKHGAFTACSWKVRRLSSE